MPTQDVIVLTGGGLKLVLAGAAIGLALSAAATRVLSGLLFGISALDPVTFVGVPLLFLAIALAATYLPARRASRVDPVIALKTE